MIAEFTRARVIHGNGLDFVSSITAVSDARIPLANVVDVIMILINVRCR
jgi:hypothetical protein